MKIILKNPAPNAESKHWGDYHFGRCLTKYLQRSGTSVLTHYNTEWKKPDKADVVIVLRGKYPYQPTNLSSLHLLWCISHPETLTVEECEHYDAVFIASATHAARLGRHCSRPVLPLLQCTDLEEFEPKGAVLERKGAIFVGNSRGVRRPCIDWAAEAGLEFSIYGKDWNRFGQKKRIVASSIANEELPALYHKARFTLNDHWQDMKRMGYINNRVFDCLAAGLPVISDDFPELRALCGDALMYYHDQASLQEALRKMETDYADIAARQQHLWRMIRNSFSFESRAHALLDMVKTLYKAR